MNTLHGENELNPIRISRRSSLCGQLDTFQLVEEWTIVAGTLKALRWFVMIVLSSGEPDKESLSNSTQQLRRLLELVVTCQKDWRYY